MKSECGIFWKIGVGWKQTAGRRSVLAFLDALAERFQEEPGELLHKPPDCLKGLILHFLKYL